MIESLEFVQSVGRFHQQPQVAFGQVTLFYGVNGSGKTSLTSILRSLALDDSKWLLQRRRSGSDLPITVRLKIADTPRTAVFTEEGGWSACDWFAEIFDDHFVNDNVYSGLDVTSAHSTGLHEVVLGREGVQIVQERERAKQAQEDATRSLQKAEESFRATFSEEYSLGVEEICSIEADALAETKLTNVRKEIESISIIETIRARPRPPKLESPIGFSANEVIEILSSGLTQVHQSALDLTKDHITKLGTWSEEWLRTGVTNNADSDNCPFCGGDLQASHLAESYASFFDKAYTTHIKTLEDSRDRFYAQFSESRLRGFIQDISLARKYMGDWQERVENIVTPDEDFDVLQAHWDRARDSLQQAFESKLSSPSSAIMLGEGFAHLIDNLNCYLLRWNQCIGEANGLIEDYLGSLETQSIAPLKRNELQCLVAHKKQVGAVAEVCDQYLAAKAAKRQADQLMNQVRQKERAYRSSVFPEFVRQVNSILDLWGVDWELSDIQGSGTARSSSASAYLKLHTTDDRIPFRPGDSEGPQFKSTLSAGDRNTLSLALFFSRVWVGGHPDSAVVIDDPVTSLDSSRRSQTVEEITKLARSGRQVIVLSHDEDFMVRLRRELTAMGIEPICHEVSCKNVLESSIAAWDYESAVMSPKARMVHRLRKFVENPELSTAALCLQDARVVMEDEMRDKHPQYFLRGTQFGTAVRKMLNDGIISQEFADEMFAISNYSSPRHHSADAHESVSSTKTVVRRALSVLEGRVMVAVP